MSNPAELEGEYLHQPVYHFYFDSTAGKLVLGFSAVLHGFSLYNPNGTTAAVGFFYDGADSTGNKDIPLSLAAGESASDWYGDRGVYFLNGLYINVTAAEIQGSVFYRRVTWQPDAP